MAAWPIFSWKYLVASWDASKPLLSYLEATDIEKTAAKEDVERPAEERDETWGWDVLEEEPEDEKEMEGGTNERGGAV
jgi:lipoprotein NlpI